MARKKKTGFQCDHPEFDLALAQDVEQSKLARVEAGNDRRASGPPLHDDARAYIASERMFHDRLKTRVVVAKGARPTEGFVERLEKREWNHPTYKEE